MLSYSSNEITVFYLVLHGIYGFGIVVGILLQFFVVYKYYQQRLDKALVHETSITRPPSYSAIAIEPPVESPSVTVV